MKKGLSLVELMVAVSILCVGIVLVIRSFLTAMAALEHSQNKISAIHFLEKKMAELEQKAIEEGGIESGSERDRTQINSRPAEWNFQIAPITIDEATDEVNEVMLTVSWKEGNINKDAVLATYLVNKKQE